MSLTFHKWPDLQGSDVCFAKVSQYFANPGACQKLKWPHYHMEVLSALLALCEGNPLGKFQKITILKQFDSVFWLFPNDQISEAQMCVLQRFLNILQIQVREDSYSSV